MLHASENWPVPNVRMCCGVSVLWGLIRPSTTERVEEFLLGVRVHGSIYYVHILYVSFDIVQFISPLFP